MYSDRKGTPDTIEFWNISKDEILIQDGIKFPQAILDAKNTVKEYMVKSHEIVLVILQILSVNLGLDYHALPNLHRLMQPSGDQLRLTKSTMYPIQQQCSPDVSFGAHTDFGSVTILFNRLDGLQVLASNGEWLYIRPLPRHAIVNLGDAMVKLTGGLMKSNIHRVVTPPGLTEVVDRYSVVYFSRPENNVQMKSLVNDGKEEQYDNHVLTAQEWITRRVKNFQTENYKDEETYEMSRGTEGHREAEMPM
jgi:isopenicillin N synthase-like dioxygenase